jgi:molecular chaperone GrpE
MMNRQDDNSSKRDVVNEDSNKEDGRQDSADAVEPGDPLAQLQAELDAAKSETAEWQDRFLRKAAEFENYRKRMDKEKIDARVQAQSSLLLEFLPVADACERALKVFEESREETGDLRQYREGVELLYQQMLDAFRKTGAEVMDTKGKQFDPHLHEALAREETTGTEEGMIVHELRQGYMFRDRLLRPAQVVVAVHPKKDDPGK